jgi:pimeloyl-ACP methyl ester carboxylesterase
MLDRVASAIESRFLARYRDRADAARRPPSDEFVELESGVVRVQRRGSHGPTVVMAPDPPNVVEHHRRVIDDLASDHVVFCFEMAGFGHSYLRDGLGFGLESHCRLLRELFDALHLREATLCIACLSGVVGMTFAARNPDCVARLVLVQVPSPDDARRWIRRADFLGAIGTPVVGQVFMHFTRRKVLRQWYRSALPEPLDPARYAEMLALSDGALGAGAGFALASAYQRIARARELELPRQTPQLHVWGGSDRTHHRNATERRALSRAMPGAQFVELPSCGHFPNLEKAPEFCQAVRAFEASTEGSIRRAAAK